MGGGGRIGTARRVGSGMIGPVQARPRVAVTLGDPGGIGPEVAVKALADADVRARARAVLFGSSRALRDAAVRAGLEPFWSVCSARQWAAGEQDVDGDMLVEIDAGADPGHHAPNARGGEESFRSVEAAIESARSGRVAAVVTGPISKQAWSLAGHGEFPGHSELFAARLGASRWAMMFESPALRVVLATCHVPLMEVPAAITPERVRDAIELGAEACRRLGVGAPRIAVCGLNPHAGEGGVLGREERDRIEPAIRACREAGIDVSGPHPGDTVFRSASRGRHDLVVAMYHDQGLIPVKLLAWESAVNVTLGLPIVRTSPDHGTAFDIAGRGTADASSMRAAIGAALRLLRGA